MPSQLTPIFSEQFAAELAELDDFSSSIGQHVRKAVRQLQTFPDMGSSQPRESLTERYGNDIQTRAIEGYLLVYTHNDTSLTLIALVWGGSVK